MLGQLSVDLIFKILDNLDVVETEELIGRLSDISSNTHEAQKQVDELITFAYKRIYRGKCIIYSNVDSGLSSSFDKSITLEQFLNLFEDSSLEADTFASTRSQSIEFVFIRQPTDYTNFTRDLNNFSDIVEGNLSDTRLSAYLDSVLQYGLHINANCVAIESTTSFLVAILKVLISISAQSNSVHHKLSHVTIKSTDIGQYFMDQWSKLFSRFDNLVSLDLSDNLIKLDESLYDFTNDTRVSTDTLGRTFQWPPNLQRLNLSLNFLTYISKSFLENLPKSLQSLTLSNNMLTKFGSELLDIALTLPLLHTLYLDNNNRLIFIDPSVFKNVSNFKLLSIKGCSLPNRNVIQLTQISQQKDFKVLQ